MEIGVDSRDKSASSALGSSVRARSKSEAGFWNTCVHGPLVSLHKLWCRVYGDGGVRGGRQVSDWN